MDYSAWTRSMTIAPLLKHLNHWDLSSFELLDPFQTYSYCVSPISYRILELYPDPYFSSVGKIWGKDYSKEFQLKKRNMKKKAATVATNLKSGTSWTITCALSWAPKQPGFAVAFLFTDCFWKSSISATASDSPFSKVNRNVTTDSSRNGIRAPVGQFWMLEIQVICIWHDKFTQEKPMLIRLVIGYRCYWQNCSGYTAPYFVESRPLFDTNSSYI